MIERGSPDPRPSRKEEDTITELMEEQLEDLEIAEEE